MRQDARAFSVLFERAQDVQEISIIALFFGRNELLLLVGIVRLLFVPQEIHVKTFEWVCFGGEARAPTFVREGRIGDHIIEGLEDVVVSRIFVGRNSGDRELRIGKGVALFDGGGGVVVEDHVHVCEGCGANVFFLPVQSDVCSGFIGDFQEQGTRSTSGIVNAGCGAGFGLSDTEYLCDQAANLGGCVKLALAFAAFCGEVAHQVFVGIAEQIVIACAIFGEVEFFVFKDGDQVREAIHHLFARSEFVVVVEVGHPCKIVCFCERFDHFFVDLVADILCSLEFYHVLKRRACRDRDRSVGVVCVLVADVFDEE